MLVSGVRNSWRRVGDETPLRGQGTIEGNEHLIESSPEARNFVVPFLVEPNRQVACAGDVFRSPRQASNGSECLLRDPAAEHHREQHRARRNDSEHEPQPSQRCVVVRERARDLQRLPRPYVDGQESHAGAARNDRLRERSGCRGDRTLGPTARQLRDLVRRARRRALRGERLHELTGRRDDRAEAARACPDCRCELGRTAFERQVEARVELVLDEEVGEDAEQDDDGAKGC